MSFPTRPLVCAQLFSGGGRETGTPLCQDSNELKERGSHDRRLCGGGSPFIPLTKVNYSRTTPVERPRSQQQPRPLPGWR